MPKTTLGKWSVALFVIMSLLTLLSLTLRPSYPSYNGNLAVFSRLELLVAMVVGIFAFLTGARAIFTQRERTLSVYISTFIGAVLTLLLIAEVF